jgi:ribosomal protein L37AE/L43A
MKTCDECRKETEERYFQEVKIPENLDEGIKDPAKARIKTVGMWVCADCKSKYDNLYKEASKFMQDSLKKVDRKLHKDEGDI